MTRNAAIAVSAKPRILKKWQAAILIAAGLAVVGAVYGDMRPRADLRVSHPSYQDIETTVSATGIVVPIHDFPARANFSGAVEKIWVKVGQKVHAGQMLIQMKDQYAVPRLEAAQAALDEAEMNQENVENNGSQEDRIAFAEDLVKAQAEQTQAARNLETMQSLLGKGSVSEAELEAAKQRLEIANSDLRALNERMTHRYSAKDIAGWKIRTDANKATLAAERVSYANAHITSPINGTVYLLEVNPYDFVSAGTDLLHIADLSRVQIRAEFEESDVGKLFVGQPVKVSWQGSPGQAWHGRVAAKPLAVVRSGARTVGQCTISLEDDKGDLPVNTGVTLTVTTEKHSHVLAIPREAMHSEGTSHFAYRVVDGKLQKTSIEIGLADALNVEVTRGLKFDDVIALHALDDRAMAANMRVNAAK